MSTQSKGDASKHLLQTPCPHCIGILSLNIQVYDDKVHELLVSPALLDSDKLCTRVGLEVSHDKNVAFSIACSKCEFQEFYEGYEAMDNAVKEKHQGLGFPSQEKSQKSKGKTLLTSFLIRRKRVASK